MKRCSKCSSNIRLEKHHWYPRVHYAGKRTGLQIWLCHDCHCRIENIILSVESYIGDVKFGTRYPLQKTCYDKITRNFIKSSNIIYVELSA
jgi:hypothetical protein